MTQHCLRILIEFFCDCQRSSSGSPVSAYMTPRGRSLTLLESEPRSDGVPDLNTLETLVRNGLLGCGATGYAALLGALNGYFVDRSSQSRASCDRWMERNRWIGKTLKTRLEEIRVERTYIYCRACRGDQGFRHLFFKNLLKHAAEKFANQIALKTQAQP